MAKVLSQQEIKDKIIKARVQLLLNSPFYGNLALRLQVVDGSDWIPTAATDGYHFYYNAEFISDLDEKEMLFLVAHEVDHCVYQHMARRGSRDPQLWNCAADFMINLELHDMKVGKLIRRPGVIEPCFDEKFRGMSSDQIYELIKNDPSMKHKDSFDVHLQPGSGPGSPKEDPSGKAGPKPLTQDQIDNLGDEITNAVIQAAKAAGAGNTPAGVRRMIEEFSDPQMDWREILATSIPSAVKSDYIWSKPSRKSWGTGAILPGMTTDDMVDVCVALDASGSISPKMLKDFLGEVKGIMEQFQDFKIRVFTFDTKIYEYKVYTPDNADEIYEYEIKGGGGTDFEICWDFMKENDILPHTFLMFTDLYPCGGWGDELYCETIFLGHGTTSIVAPFGTTVYYTE